MLGLADWLIPEETHKHLSQADYLMIVLAIYFHDLGLVVTAEEFERRGTSAFGKYVEDNLFSGKEGEDYKAEVFNPHSDETSREKFLYQEFVRGNHAKRVRTWIDGNFDSSLGVSDKIFEEVNQLLNGLPRSFRNDLAVVCESHHLSDLDDLDKYSISQPYGDSDAETANVQYASIILRTADLMHITRDRTPSVQYRIINPQNPKSQEEWAKQNAVKRVRPRRVVSTDESGREVEQISDVIEVFADFTNAEGYFGLTSYLTWAEKEIKQSKQWVERSRVRGATNYIFPWSSIDQSKVNSDGFLKEQFAFSIDQEKILNLLTGHTL